MHRRDSFREATVQDIQLELVRRSSFNAFDGEKVAASLLRHRHLWRAVLMDRLGLPNFNHPGRLLTASLIKLRDLSSDVWNVDTLYVLCDTREQARQLARLADEEDWGGEPRLYEDQEEIDYALGTGRREYGLLSVWWD